MRKWKIGIIFFAAITAALMTTVAAMQQEQQTLSEKLIRLHVIANSDSKEDQIIKLQVRDAVLAVTEPVMRAGEDPEMILRDMLPEIKQAAESCLRAQGSGDRVEVMFGYESYPTRVYENFTLPAGTYRSLRVIIGEGDGHNWWCVVFPSICFRATAAELEEAAAVAGFTEEEVRFITDDDGNYELKFKSLELLQKLKTAIFR